MGRPWPTAGSGRAPSRSAHGSALGPRRAWSVDSTRDDDRHGSAARIDARRAEPASALSHGCPSREQLRGCRGLGSRLLAKPDSAGQVVGAGCHPARRRAGTGGTRDESQGALIRGHGRGLRGPARDLRAARGPLPRHRGLAFIFHADLDTLIDIKSRIDDPRHQEDVRVLKMVRDRRATE